MKAVAPPRIAKGRKTAPSGQKTETASIAGDGPTESYGTVIGIRADPPADGLTGIENQSPSMLPIAPQELHENGIPPSTGQKTGSPRGSEVGPPRFELELLAPQARRIPSYPTGPFNMFDDGLVTGLGNVLAKCV